MALRSTKLGIPYIQASQATPEITHNEALYMLEALTHGAIDRTNAPPGSPADGDVYLVGTAGSGAWAGRSNHIAVWMDGSWGFIPGFDDDGALIAIGAAHEGLTIYVHDENLYYRWTGSTWSPVIQDPPFTVGTLPAAATFPRGRAFVTDASAAFTSATVGTVAAGGGANIAPVYSDGTDWRYG